MFPSRRITTSGGDVFRDEYSLAFDGTNDYVQLGTAFQSTFRDSFTISMWIKPDDGQPSSLEIIIGCNNTSDQDSIAIVLEADGDIAFSYQSDDDKVVGTSDETVFADGQAEWTHIVCSASSGGNLVTFINGVIKDTSSATTATFGDWTSTDALYIGANNDGGTGTSFFAGKISEVAIWSEAFSSSQVKQLYNGREPFDARNIAKSNLVSYWRMGDGVLDHRQTNGLVADQVNATLGSELITVEADRTFASDTSFWTKEDGVTFSGGTMLFTDVGENAGFSRASFLTAQSVYRVTFDCTSYTDGSIHVHNGTIFTPPDNTSTGTKTLYFTATTTLFQLRAGTADSNFAIDNLSIKEVNGNAGALVNFDGSDFKGDVPR